MLHQLFNINRLTTLRVLHCFMLNNALFYVVNFSNVLLLFVDKITQSISNVYVRHLILYLRCKFHGNIPNDCQDIANLLLGYFNLGHPVDHVMSDTHTRTHTHTQC